MNPGEYSPLALAFLGDAVIEIIARETILRTHNVQPETLFALSKLFAKASAQSAAAERVKAVLTEEEYAVYRRGRNAKGRVPRGAKTVDYRRASGLECLFGYLRLKGDDDRIHELFSVAYSDIINE